MSQITTCSHCSTRINVPEETAWKTMICPQCLSDVDNPQLASPIRAPDLNTDVKRDLKVGSIVLVALVGLCVLGIAMARANPLGWEFLLLFFLPISLCVVIGVAIILALVRRGSSVARAPEVKNVVGCFILVLGTITATIIFVYFACAMALDPKVHH